MIFCIKPVGSNQHVAVLWLAILSTPHMRSGSQVTWSILVMFYQAFSENAATIRIYGRFFIGNMGEELEFSGLRGILLLMEEILHHQPDG